MKILVVVIEIILGTQTMYIGEHYGVSIVTNEEGTEYINVFDRSDGVIYQFIGDAETPRKINLENDFIDKRNSNIEIVAKEKVCFLDQKMKKITYLEDALHPITNKPIQNKIECIQGKFKALKNFDFNLKEFAFLEYLEPSCFTKSGRYIFKSRLVHDDGSFSDIMKVVSFEEKKVGKMFFEEYLIMVKK